MRAIDLFCGIGGFRIALENCGYECVFSSEIDYYAKGIYEANFGEVPRGDITAVDAGDIPSHDLLCAGFPCQSFSIGGNKQGLDDSRGALFYEIIRIAKHHKPPMILLENVPNIRSVDGGKVYAEVLSQLQQAGYYVLPLELNAGHYGFRQNRNRIYFVCTRDKMPYIHIQPRNAFNTLDPLLESAVDERWYVNDNKAVFYPDTIPDKSVGRLAVVGHIRRNMQGYRIYHPKGYALTLTARGGGVGAQSGIYLVGDRLRRLTPLECKRVMGFPDNHIISDGIRGIGQLGNAVIPGMVEMILDRINGRDKDCLIVPEYRPPDKGNKNQLALF